MKKLTILSLLLSSCTGYNYIVDTQSKETIYIRGEKVYIYSSENECIEFRYTKKDTIKQHFLNSKHLFKITQDTVYFDSKKLAIKKGGF